MIPLYLFIIMVAASFGLIGYSWYDHDNRLYANIIAMFIAAVLLTYLGTVVSTFTVYDAYYCTYNTTYFTHTCVEIPFNAPGLGIALQFVAFCAFVYTFYMLWDAWNDFRAFKRGGEQE